MRIIFVCAVVFLQMNWLSLSSGQAETATHTDCSSLHGQDECCSSNSSCVFVNCTVNNIMVAGCYNSTEDAGCTDAAKAVNICPVASAANGTTEAPATPTSSLGGNETGTTQTSAHATSAPVRQGVVNCTNLSSDQNQCCAAGNSSACIFFNCTGANVTVSTTVCAPANATPVCTTKGDKPSADMCADSSSTTPTSGGESSTQSPSTKEAGGQKFDAASFIGGIVLCAGVLAIGYFGLKFYRSRQEKNYRSM